ncbi:MAG: SsrA-binding protein SmpB [Deltaproteobacteria bacterium]|nr:SsrA-binding protein SmpB [Deltaproteobacteria bacterium]
MSEKIVATNRKAGFHYHLLDKYEAGMVLLGSEVKSLRDGQANLGDSYVMPKGNDLYLVNLHISVYPPANILNHEPLRSRKLLLHEREIDQILGKMKEKGLTVVPTKIYFKRGRAKVEIVLAKGKKFSDKRESLKKKVHDREMERGIKGVKRG